MSRTHRIDNASPLFDFDSYERFEPLSLLEESAREPLTPPISTPGSVSRATLMLDDPPSSAEMEAQSSSVLKGKQAALPGKSEPMSIPTLADDVQFEPDVFSLSFASVGSSSSRYDPLPSSFIQTAQQFMFDDVDHIAEVSADHERDEPTVGKGKGREPPPTLPPLSFSPTQFTYDSTEWSSLAGPSSYSSVCSSMAEAESSSGSPSRTGRATESAPTTPSLPAPPVSAVPRRRTVSNASKPSLRSLSTPSLPKMKVKFAGSKNATGTLARKLLFKKSPSNSPRSPSVDLSHTITDHTIFPDLADLQDVEQGSCLIPWSRDMRTRSLLASPVVETNAVWGTVIAQSVRRSSRLVEPVTMRTKGRAYSSPLPLPTNAFDIVPLAPVDIFSEPEQVVPSCFDEWLPRELKLHVLTFLIDLFEEEFRKRVADGKWTAHKASSSRNKWVGRDGGVRELFKLSRVRMSQRCLLAQLG